MNEIESSAFILMEMNQKLIKFFENETEQDNTQKSNMTKDTVNKVGNYYSCGILTWKNII